MPLLSSDAKLFGIDLSSLGGQLREAWQQLAHLPWMRRFMPRFPVKVAGWESRPDGMAWVRGDRLEWVQRANGGTTASPDYAAVLLPSEQVLVRTLRLPAMSPKALHGAVQLDVQMMSPFTEEQTLWAYAARSPGGASSVRLVDVVITSRDQVEGALKEQGYRLPAGMAPEVWADAVTQTIMITGFGEQRRLAREARQRIWLLTGVLVVAALAAALAATPTAQLYLRAEDANAQFARLTQATRDVVTKRQALVAEAESVSALMDRRNQQIDHLRVMALLTRVLPDDTAVQRVQFKGDKLTVQGLSDDTSEAVRLLSKEPGLRDVRLPSAVTRSSRTSKESFTLEATLDPAVLGVHAMDEAKDESEATGTPSVPAKEGA
jgi:general secretion pathway protein L